tara:strand:- start:381 stop:2294 length:1914 start_codon:yes stop_codon:yes gene_type:complete
MKIKIIDLKKEKNITFPKKIVLNDMDYFLLKNDGKYFLGSTVCPHMGGSIEFDKKEEVFLCPIHNWKFNKSSGKCTNSSQNMSLIDINITDNVLWVDSSKITKKKSKIIAKTLTTQNIKKPIKIKLISHATLNISLKKLNVLIDPWIEGPAMLGAWRQYPLTDIKAKDIKPYSIIITHEHSDHFHIPTLIKFNKKTPILIPDFPNKRMQKFLKKLGFINVKVVSFEQEINIHEKIKIKFFKPVSVFNDSITLIDIDGYRVLNLNDAGLNPSIAEDVKPVDAVSCIFSTGASGYPFTWQHLSLKEKKNIMKKACEGKIKLLIEATKLYEANYIIPFASHFRLWQPEHEHYLKSIITNSIDDILIGFKNNGVENKLIDLIPGDSWNTENNEINRYWEDRKLIYNQKHILKTVKEDYGKNGHNLKISDYWNTKEKKVTEQELKNYFLYLNDSPDIKTCEDINVNLKCWGKKWDNLNFEFNFEILNGNLQIKKKDSQIKADTKYRLEITEDILQPIINGNLSWDEARVGYWIKWWRDTDQVKTGFLRLLQGPYEQKKSEKLSIFSGTINEKMSISSMIEIFGEEVEKIFEKYGMFCTGCDLSPWEDIISGAKKHGIKKNKIDLLLSEIKELQLGLSNQLSD